jgi:hypothetical protein
VLEVALFVDAEIGALVASEADVVALAGEIEGIGPES